MSKKDHRTEACLRFLNIDGKCLIFWSNKEDYARLVAGDDSVKVSSWMVESGADILLEFKDGNPTKVMSL